MKINPKIKEVMADHRINYDDALGYLFAIYYGHRPSYIPASIRAKVNSTKVVSHDPKKGYTFTIPLFLGVETAFEWVETEYVVLFEETNPDKGGKVAEATKRMKKFFADNPQYRKEDVIGATEMYLSNTDSTYIMFPHYFIKKGRGLDATETLLDWVKKYKLANSTMDRSDVQNTMR
jgi:hypothetical protein